MTEETIFHDICQETLEWIDQLSEFEKMLEETDSYTTGNEKKKYKSLKKDLKIRIDGLNINPENWEKKILEEYGLLK